MKQRSLYLPLVLCVLLAAACDRQNADAPAESQDVPDPSEETTDHLSERRATSGQQNILVLGNSIAAGYGLSQKEAFPAILQGKIDSLGWHFNVINAGLSGETTAGGLRRLPWLLRQPIDVLIIELGGNDGLRGIDPEVTRANLAAIVDTTRSRYPNTRILLSGMQMPPNLGREYTEQFRQVFPDVAEEKNIALVPFILEGVGGVDSLNQEDGIHPTSAGQRVVAENIWQELKPMLASVQESEPAAQDDLLQSEPLSL